MSSVEEKNGITPTFDTKLEETAISQENNLTELDYEKRGRPMRLGKV